MLNVFARKSGENFAKLWCAMLINSHKNTEWCNKNQKVLRLISLKKWQDLGNQVIVHSLPPCFHFIWSFLCDGGKQFWHHLSIYLFPAQKPALLSEVCRLCSSTVLKNADVPSGHDGEVLRVDPSRWVYIRPCLHFIITCLFMNIGGKKVQYSMTQT